MRVWNFVRLSSAAVFGTSLDFRDFFLDEHQNCLIFAVGFHLHKSPMRLVPVSQKNIEVFHGVFHGISKDLRAPTSPKKPSRSVCDLFLNGMMTDTLGLSQHRFLDQKHGASRS